MLRTINYWILKKRSERLTKTTATVTPEFLEQLTLLLDDYYFQQYSHHCLSFITINVYTKNYDDYLSLFKGAIKSLRDSQTISFDTRLNNLMAQMPLSVYLSVDQKMSNPLYVNQALDELIVNLYTQLGVLTRNDPNSMYSYYQRKLFVLVDNAKQIKLALAKLAYETYKEGR